MISNQASAGGRARRTLTRQQRTDKIVEMVSDGMSYGAIAEELGVSRSTVSSNFRKRLEEMATSHPGTEVLRQRVKVEIEWWEKRLKKWVMAGKSEEDINSRAKEAMPLFLKSLDRTIKIFGLSAVKEHGGDGGSTVQIINMGPVVPDEKTVVVPPPVLINGDVVDGSSS